MEGAEEVERGEEAPVAEAPMEGVEEERGEVAPVEDVEWAPHEVVHFAFRALTEDEEDLVTRTLIEPEVVRHPRGNASPREWKAPLVSNQYTSTFLPPSPG